VGSPANFVAPPQSPNSNPHITTTELAGAVGITPKGIEWQLIRLKKDSALKRVGPAKGGDCEVVGS
jgi:hypothetical protein